MAIFSGTHDIKAIQLDGILIVPCSLQTHISLPWYGEANFPCSLQLAAYHSVCGQPFHFVLVRLASSTLGGLHFCGPLLDWKPSMMVICLHSSGPAVERLPRSWVAPTLHDVRSHSEVLPCAFVWLFQCVCPPVRWVFGSCCLGRKNFHASILKAGVAVCSGDCTQRS